MSLNKRDFIIGFGALSVGAALPVNLPLLASRKGQRREATFLLLGNHQVLFAQKGVMELKAGARGLEWTGTAVFTAVYGDMVDAIKVVLPATPWNDKKVHEFRGQGLPITPNGGDICVVFG